MSTGSILLRRRLVLALLAVTACGMDADPRQFGADCRIDRVADVTPAGIDVLIGLDWLAGRHVWLSREAGALFIHP